MYREPNFTLTDDCSGEEVTGLNLDELEDRLNACFAVDEWAYDDEAGNPHTISEVIADIMNRLARHERTEECEAALNIHIERMSYIGYIEQMYPMYDMAKGDDRNHRSSPFFCVHKSVKKSDHSSAQETNDDNDNGCNQKHGGTNNNPHHA